LKLSLRQLQIFCAIAQQGSTTTAAIALSLSQSATSAALNELENALDTRLFDRVGKRLVLNENGRALLPQARKMLENAQQIETSFLPGHAELKTPLRVGCSTTIGNYVLPLILGELRQSAPQLRADVDMANSMAIARKVADFELDMGLIEGPCRLPELSAQPWLVDELLIVAGRRHSLALKQQITLDDLRTAEWLLREPGSGTREEVEQLLLRHLHNLAETRQIGSSEAIKHTLVQGIGISCLSRWVVGDLLASQDLVKLSHGLPVLTRRFFLIRHRDKYISPGLGRFWESCNQFANRKIS
jgi:DNA-binding transcriptional LysR family regulator